MQKVSVPVLFSDFCNRKDTDMKRKLMVIIAMLLVGLQLWSCGTIPPEPSQNTTESTAPTQNSTQGNTIESTASTQGSTPDETETDAPAGFDIADAARYSRIACVGDSITYGIGADNLSSGSYPARLQALLGNRYEVGNFGWSGSTFCGYTPNSKIYAEGEQFRASIDFEPDVVIIMLGTNDTTFWNYPQTAAGVEKAARDLVHFYRTLPSQPEVILCTPITRYDKKVNDLILRDEVVPLLRRVAAAEDCWFVDLHAQTSNWESTNLKDGLHPNSGGYRKLAKLILGALRNPAKVS